MISYGNYHKPAMRQVRCDILAPNPPCPKVPHQCQGALNPLSPKKGTRLIAAAKREVPNTCHPESIAREVGGVALRRRVESVVDELDTTIYVYAGRGLSGPRLHKITACVRYWTPLKAAPRVCGQAVVA